MSDTIKVAMVSAVASVVITAGVFVGLVEPEIADPTPETPSVSANCPDGWADTSSEDEHMIVLSCQKDDWLVILHSDGTFSHGLQKNTPNAEFKFLPSEVPGWPR